MTQRRRLALLSLLAASTSGISRDRIVGLLWPDNDEERARHALAQLLHSLRRDLGDELVAGSATALRLNPAILSSDVQDFTTALAAGDLERAAGLYQGPFLDGFYLNGCPDFERWVDERRAALAHQAEDAIESLGKREPDPSRAANWWRRLALLRPLDSRVALALMQSLARTGDRTGALDHARVHGELLRAELDTPLPPELTAYVDTLREAPTPVRPTPAPKVAAPTPPRATPIGLSSLALPLPASTERRRINWRSPLGGAAFATVVIIGTALVLGLRAGATNGEPRRLIIADVVNTTNDPVFDRTVPVALSAVLGQSPRVRVVTPDQIGRALVRMRRPGADSTIDEGLAREIAERDAVHVVAVPSINRAEGAYEISAKFVDPATGAVLGFAAERATERAEVLDALDRLGRRLRRELGESRWSVSRNSRSLPGVTTTSLEALKKFADGERAFRDARGAAAEDLWEQAIALDSTFAAAHANLGMFAFRNNKPTLGESHYAHAFRHLNGLPEREQVLIRAAAFRGRGDFVGAANLLNAHLAQYPDDVGARNQLGYDYVRLGRSADAIDALSRVLAVDSLDFTTWISVARAERQLGHAPLSLRAYQRTFALAPTQLTANDNFNLEYAGAFVSMGLLDSAKTVIDLLVSAPDRLRKARGLRSLAFLSSYRGRYADAATSLADAVLLTRASPVSATSEVRNHLLLATTLDEIGRGAEAARALDSAFATVSRMDAEATLLYWVGKALARSGDTRRSARLADVLSKKVRPGSPTDAAALEALRGEVLLASGQLDEAMRHLDSAWRADSNSNIRESVAYGAATSGKFERAATLYERMGSGSAFGSENQHFWRLAPYWLGRVHERANKANEARAAYEKFLSSWPDPKPDLRSVADARQRLGRLRGG
jgi:DNA-binding SARP family transcriptional activator/tetratricopeptide (TPR) repeat protein